MHIHTRNWDMDDHGHTLMTGISCRECHEVVAARLAIASPVRLYVVQVECAECGTPFTPPFDQFSREVV